MAHPESSILTRESGRAQRVALGFFCLVAGAQLVLVGRSLWLEGRQRVAGAGVAVEPVPTAGASSVAGASGGLGPPVTASVTVSSRAPAEGGAGAVAPTVSLDRLLSPPPPGQLAGEEPVAMAPSPALARPAIPGLNPPTPGQLATEQVGLSGGGGGAGLGAGPGGGLEPVRLPELDAEVAQLLETVAQLRQAGETDGLMDLLKAAEGMDQNHPAVLKEFALTYEQMGLTDRAGEYWRRILALGPGLGGTFFTMARQRVGGTVPGGDAAVVGGGAEALANLTGNAGGVMPFDAAALTRGPQGGQEVETLELDQITREAGAVLGVGPCRVMKDAAVVEGERRLVRIPIARVGDEAIEPTAVNVDVFFFDKVNGTGVEPTRADPPVATWAAEPVDWKGEAVEPLEVTYVLPPLNAREEKDHGKRSFHGYLIKLYYQNRLQAVVAEPKELLNPEGVGGRR